MQFSRLGAGDDTLEAGFAQYSLNNLIRSYGGNPGASVGSCSAYEVYGPALKIVDPITPAYLDAGPQLVLSGPNGNKTIPVTSTGIYDATLAAPSPLPFPYLAPGNYTVANGSGGANVGAFNWSLTLPANVTPTNLPSKVTRAQDLTLTWNGGAGFSVVTIFGYTGLAVTSTNDSFVEFICNANASAGQFTIPSSILSLLPANGFGSPGVPGVNIQIAGIPLINFTAPGIDAAVFSGFITTGGIATIQ